MLWDWDGLSGCFWEVPRGRAGTRLSGGPSERPVLTLFWGPRGDSARPCVLAVFGLGLGTFDAPWKRTLQRPISENFLKKKFIFFIFFHFFSKKWACAEIPARGASLSTRLIRDNSTQERAHIGLFVFFGNGWSN